MQENENLTLELNKIVNSINTTSMNDETKLLNLYNWFLNNVSIHNLTLTELVKDYVQSNKPNGFKIDINQILNNVLIKKEATNKDVAFAFCDICSNLNLDNNNIFVLKTQKGKQSYFINMYSDNKNLYFIDTYASIQNKMTQICYYPLDYFMFSMKIFNRLENNVQFETIYIKTNNAYHSKKLQLTTFNYYELINDGTINLLK